MATKVEYIMYMSRWEEYRFRYIFFLLPERGISETEENNPLGAWGFSNSICALSWGHIIFFPSLRNRIELGKLDFLLKICNIYLYY